MRDCIVQGDCHLLNVFKKERADKKCLRNGVVYKMTIIVCGLFSIHNMCIVLYVKDYIASDVLRKKLTVWAGISMKARLVGERFYNLFEGYRATSANISHVVFFEICGTGTEMSTFKP